MFGSKPQPAVKSYFFGKGFKDLYRMIRDFWALNLASARQYYERSKQHWADGGWSMLPALPYAFAAGSIFFFGSIWFIIVTTIHVLILAIFFLLIYVAYSIIWLVERGFMILRGVFTVCPNCHRRSMLPHYLCPNCKVVHTRLAPSSYGLFTRTCLCGERLPTTFFARRQHLKDFARCPSEECGRLLGVKESTPLCFPLVGGPSVGKTCYLFAATRQFLNQVAPAHQWEVRFIGSFSRNLHERIKQQWENGVRPDKTMETNPPAFNLFLHSRRWNVEKLLYFYDAAGEAYGNPEALITHRFYGFLHGFIFMIDPFSIPTLVSQYQEELRLHGKEIRPGAMSVEETFDVMVANLDKHHNLKANARIDKPLAIVINKVDAFDLEDRVGENAVRKLMMADPSIPGTAEGMDQVCQYFLHSLGLESFLKKVKRHFDNYQYFSVSALGRTADDSNQPFAPRRVLDPLLWLLAHADRDMNKEIFGGEQRRVPPRREPREQRRAAAR
jgi:hypothetical protein